MKLIDEVGNPECMYAGSEPNSNESKVKNWSYYENMNFHFHDKFSFFLHLIHMSLAQGHRAHDLSS